jgi:uncharacterized protein (TIGR02147 family)
MEQSLFEFDDYKAYLREFAGQKKRSGVRLAMAKALSCQPGHISHVLNENAHFSLEQGETLSTFLAHGKEERHYFLLLLQKQRASTLPLEKYFEDQIKEIKRNRLVLTERLEKGHRLSETERAKYYSSWTYAAVHIGLSIPALQDKKVLSDFFQIKPLKIAEIIEFLIGAGLVLEKPGGGYSFGPTQVRIGNDSHHIIKHHTNWRNRAIESLEREEPEDLHYSGVFTLSQSDALKVKDRLIEEIKACQKVIRDSPEEKIIGFNVDFFNLRIKTEA